MLMLLLGTGFGPLIKNSVVAFSFEKPLLYNPHIPDFKTPGLCLYQPSDCVPAASHRCIVWCTRCKDREKTPVITSSGQFCFQMKCFKM